MSHVTGNIVIGVGLGAVTLVLVAGLINMMRGGSANASQRFMRWRVGLQFLTIVVVMLVLYFKGRA